MHAPRSSRSGERGIALVMALLVLLVVSIVGAMLMASLQSETKMSSHDLRQAGALNVAEAGVGEAIADKKILENAAADMTKISGQKPVVTKSRKAIAAFKIRENVPIGTMVTLRGIRMYEFLDRFVTIALPRVRDFRGISGRSFDGRGNYNVGIKEQIIFPEIEYDKIDAIRGLNISITTSAKNDDECKALLSAFRFPFKN